MTTLETDILVVGSGLSGLAAGFYFPTSTIVSSRYNQPIEPFFLHQDLRIDQLLMELGLKTTTKVDSVGYVWKNKVYDGATRIMLDEYANKAHGGYSNPAQMNSRRGSIVHYYDEAELYPRLISRLFDRTIVNPKLTTVDPEKHTAVFINNNGLGELTVVYRKMISTVPYHVLARAISGPKATFPAPSVDVYRMNILTPEFRQDHEGYCYYYCSDQTHPWFRFIPWSSFDGIAEYAFEAEGSKYAYSRWDGVDVDSPHQDIYLLGRGAELKQVRFQDVLGKIGEFRCMIA